MEQFGYDATSRKHKCTLAMRRRCTPATFLLERCNASGPLGPASGTWADIVTNLRREQSRKRKMLSSFRSEQASVPLRVTPLALRDRERGSTPPPRGSEVDARSQGRRGTRSARAGEQRDAGALAARGVVAGDKGAAHDGCDGAAGLASGAKEQHERDISARAPGAREARSSLKLSDNHPNPNSSPTA
eukprot:gene16640-biopygen13609